MLRVRFQIAVLGGLVFLAIHTGCQFQVALGPVENQAPAASEYPTRPVVSRTPAAPAKTRGEELAVPEIAAISVPIAASSGQPDSRIQSASGWRATVKPTAKSEVTQTSATGVAANRRSDRHGVQFADLPMPAPPAELPAIESSQLAGDSAGAGEAMAESSLENYPINLPAALRLAGGESWDVQLASEKVREAYARLDAAKALWLPSLVAGIGYTKHEGQIQNTGGSVIDVSRNAFFVGGGAQGGTAPLAGGSGGPARLFVDLSLADAIFEPLVARQTANAEQWSQAATYNDTLQSASLAYFELVRGQGQLVYARQNLKHAQELVSLTESFVSSGKGSRADSALARTEESTRRQLVVQARLAMQIASAELARILRLDPETTLFALEERLIPLEYIDPAVSLSDHIGAGLHQRPEISEAQFRLDARSQRVRAEQFRPFIPHLSVGASAGGFGGGVNDDLKNLKGRSDFDIAAVWQLKNLGFGTQAAIATSESQYSSAYYRLERLRDMITTEIIQEYHAVAAQRERIGLAETNVKEALESLNQNKARIRGLEGLPLEALQSVQAVAQANAAFLDSVVDFNQAQVRLLRATGRALGGDQ